jgi:hypothetical protein
MMAIAKIVTAAAAIRRLSDDEPATMGCALASSMTSADRLNPAIDRKILARPSRRRDGVT